MGFWGTLVVPDSSNSWIFLQPSPHPQSLSYVAFSTTIPVSPGLIPVLFLVSVPSVSKTPLFHFSVLLIRPSHITDIVPQR